MHSFLGNLSGLLDEIKEKSSFVLICLAIFVAFFLAALVLERYVLKLPKRKKVKDIAVIAMLAAIGGVLMFLEIPLFFVPGFYKIDLSEVPVLICGFIMGPEACVCCEFIKILIKLLLKGTTTAFVGDFASFVIGCTFVLPAVAVYHVKGTKRFAILGLTMGTICMTVFGSLFNAVYLLPTYASIFGMPLDAIISMGTAVNSHITSVSTFILFAVVPFNILKGVIDSVLAFLLFLRIKKAIR